MGRNSFHISEMCTHLAKTHQQLKGIHRVILQLENHLLSAAPTRCRHSYTQAWDIKGPYNGDYGYCLLLRCDSV